MKSKKLFVLGLTALASVGVVGGSIAAQDVTSALADVALAEVNCDVHVTTSAKKVGEEVNGQQKVQVKGITFILTNVKIDDNHFVFGEGSSIALSKDEYKDGVGGLMHNLAWVVLSKTTNETFNYTITLGSKGVEKSKKLDYPAKDSNEISFRFTSSEFASVRKDADYFSFKVNSGSVNLKDIHAGCNYTPVN